MVHKKHLHPQHLFDASPGDDLPHHIQAACLAMAGSSAARGCMIIYHVNTIYNLNVYYKLYIYICISVSIIVYH